jgi:hypothetical protein
LDYIPVFVANGFYENATQFKREHVVYKSYSKFPQVDRYTGLGRLLRLRNQLLVEMPYLQHTVRHNTDVTVGYDEDLFKRVVKRKWHVYENRPLKDAGALFRVMRKVVNSDSRRLEAVTGLLQRHPKLIVFYNFDYELELLRSLSDKFGTTSIPEDMVMAEWNGHRHEPIPKTDRWVYLVQYAAGAEGWNCITTNAMCFYSLPYSYKLWHQAHGRIDRLNTGYTDLWYYSLVSESIIDKAIRRALAAKKSFNESVFMGRKGIK